MRLIKVVTDFCSFESDISSCVVLVNLMKGFIATFPSGTNEILNAVNGDAHPAMPFLFLR
jgi:hypothetical protein